MPLDAQIPLHSGFAPKTEPEQVLDGIDLTGRVAVVTGGYSGIGLETTRALAGAGATVVVPVRTPAKAEENLAGVDGNVTAARMDLADLDSVRSFAAELAAQHDTIDLLINNAGVMATPEQRVGPGWEYQFGICHLGHFALSTELLPLLERSDAARVVALSSIAHKRNGILWGDIHFESTDYDKWQAYAQAKSANALFAVAMNERLAASGGRAFAVHPGGIFTPLQRDLPLEEQVALGWLNADGSPSPLAEAGFKSTTQGCTTTLWAATSPMLDDLGGVYCEDCDIAAPATPETPYSGVAPHAVDGDEAARLWDVSEAMLAAA